MGLLDQVTSLLGGGDAKKLTQNIGGLLDDVGGVSGLVAKLDSAGLGDLAKSWVGTGPNKAISADEITKALGSDELTKIAQKAGISPDRAAAGLSKVLPDSIDKLTPGGDIPDPSALADALEKLT